jgi:hypothetical protein
MTTISATFARHCGALLVAVLMITGEGTPYAAKEQCWDECVREMGGRCFLWKQRCELIPEAPKMPITGMGEDFDQQPPVHRQSPSRDGTLNPDQY